MISTDTEEYPVWLELETNGFQVLRGKTGFVQKNKVPGDKRKGHLCPRRKRSSVLNGCLRDKVQGQDKISHQIPLPANLPNYVVVGSSETQLGGQNVKLTRNENLSWGPQIKTRFYISLSSNTKSKGHEQENKMANIILTGKVKT